MSWEVAFYPFIYPSFISWKRTSRFQDIPDSTCGASGYSLGWAPYGRGRPFVGPQLKGHAQTRQVKAAHHKLAALANPPGLLDPAWSRQDLRGSWRGHAAPLPPILSAAGRRSQANAARLFMLARQAGRQPLISPLRLDEDAVGPPSRPPACLPPSSRRLFPDQPVSSANSEEINASVNVAPQLAAIAPAFGCVSKRFWKGASGFGPRGDSALLKCKR